MFIILITITIMKIMTLLAIRKTCYNDNTDFKVDFAGITRLGEFKYTHGGSVQPGLDYHIH